MTREQFNTLTGLLNMAIAEEDNWGEEAKANNWDALERIHTKVSEGCHEALNLLLCYHITSN